MLENPNKLTEDRVDRVKTVFIKKLNNLKDRCRKDENVEKIKSVRIPDPASLPLVCAVKKS